MLKEKKAENFSTQIAEASEFDAQMIMAKITGNFKYKNERDGK